VKLTRSATLGAALAAALVAAAPAAASPAGDTPTAKASGDGPTAKASGDPAPVYPALVQTRITRVNNAIDRLTDYVDDNDAAGVDRTGKVIRRQLAAAWRGAVYYIKNPPPPVGEDAPAAARASQDDAGPVVADQFTTAAAVYDAQHQVAATIAQLTDGARVPILNSMSKTLLWTLDARDKAVATTHALDVPPGEDAGEDAVSFGTVMPGTILGLDDEIQQIKGLKSDAKDLRPGGKKILNSALAQTLLTELQINTYWPPVIGD
jgi:hypothetical protein